MRKVLLEGGGLMVFLTMVFSSQPHKWMCHSYFHVISLITLHKKSLFLYFLFYGIRQRSKDSDDAITVVNCHQEKDVSL